MKIISITWEQLQEPDPPSKYEMELTKKQKEIVKYLSKHDKITKKKAIELVGGQYNNQEKYVGEILSRMIESNTIERLKRGVYILKSKSLKDLNNQLNLFQ